MIFRALVLAAFLLVHGELCAEPLPADAGFAPKLRLPGTRGGDPEIEESRPLLRARLGLAESGDPLKLLHHAVTVLGADVVVRRHDGYPAERLAGRFKWP